MAPCITKLFIIMAMLAFVNCLPMLKDQSVEEGTDVEEVGSEEGTDLTGDGYNTDSDSAEDFFESDDQDKSVTEVLSSVYARSNEIAKLAILLKIIDDGLKLKGGVDQISNGIDLKKEGYQEVLNKETFKSGLEKSIEGDKMVLAGMRQGGKALFSLGLETTYAIALQKLGGRK